MAIKDELFDEVLALNDLLKNIPDDKFYKNEAETKWMKIFDGNDSFPLLYKVVSIVFSLPFSDAFVERVFSLALAQWTDERNKLCEKAVKSLFQVQVNLNYSCYQMHGVISKNKQLMEKLFLGENMALNK